MARSAASVSYPHPVLGIRDDIAGELTWADCEIDCQVEETSIKLGGIAVSNPTLDGLIKAGKAAFTCLVSCTATYFREAQRIAEPGTPLKIRSEKLVGKVELQVMICATEALHGYHPDGLNADFGEASFELNKGDILALAETTYSFFVDKDFDPLESGVSSIVRVRGGGEANGAFKVQFDGDQIELTLSPADWEAYGRYRLQASYVVHAILVTPVLVEAIRFVRSTEVDHEALRSCKWFARLEALLLAHNVSPAVEASVAAQLLLRSAGSTEGPVTRAFKQLDSLQGSDQ